MHEHSYVLRTGTGVTFPTQAFTKCSNHAYYVLEVRQNTNPCQSHLGFVAVFTGHFQLQNPNLQYKLSY